MSVWSYKLKSNGFSSWHIDDVFAYSQSYKIDSGLSRFDQLLINANSFTLLTNKKRGRTDQVSISTNF